MLQLLMLTLAAAAQDRSGNDPPQGPMPGENHSLSQDHPNREEQMFPDLAVKDLRIDQGTLYVLVTNESKVRADGPIRITARAEANGIKSEATAARIGSLKGGESRWVPLSNFAVKSASTARYAPIVTLDGASLISAAVRLPPPGSAVDRSGQGCTTSLGCIRELNESNNDFSAAGSDIARGRPE
jgi:hypothetical protein